MPDYFFKPDSRNPLILKLKKDFFNTRPYLKIKNTITDVFDGVFGSSITEFQQYHRLKIQDGSLNEETYAQIDSKISEVQIEMPSFHQSRKEP